MPVAVFLASGHVFSTYSRSLGGSFSRWACSRGAAHQSMLEIRISLARDFTGCTDKSSPHPCHPCNARSKVFMNRPTVVILCPKEFRFTDHEASVERPFLDDVADVATVWLDFNAPLPEQVLDAHALILW